MFHNFKNSNLDKLISKNSKFYLIDGITGSGKTSLSIILKKKNSKKNKLKIISKDLFLKSRKIRIAVAKKNDRKKNINQNDLQYDLKKYNKILNQFKKKNKSKIFFNKLYNRKTGKNDLTFKFQYKSDITYLIEGIFVAKDFNFLPEKETTKIFIQSDIYSSLVEKLRRIRDKKVSISLVINEYIKIHLYSYLNYFKKINFDFIINKKGKIDKFNNLHFLKIKNEIINFLIKHD